MEQPSGSNLQFALDYADEGHRVFPCQWVGPKRKAPLTPNGVNDATTRHDQIRFWWRRWPNALIGFATGHDRAVLDIDLRQDKNGFWTLAGLGFTDLPATPTVRTPSGGYHLHLALPAGGAFANTQGTLGRGIGVGLDWRGIGGYAFLPAPDTGYTWIEDTQSLPLAAIPEALMPRLSTKTTVAGTPGVCTELMPYGEAALRSAATNIMAAPNGEQEATLNRECYAIGTLAGAGIVPTKLAFDVLLMAALDMPSFDPRRPWHSREVERKVRRAFNQGVAHPRPDWDKVEEEIYRRIEHAADAWEERGDA